MPSFATERQNMKIVKLNIARERTASVTGIAIEEKATIEKAAIVEAVIEAAVTAAVAFVVQDIAATTIKVVVIEVAVTVAVTIEALAIVVTEAMATIVTVVVAVVIVEETISHFVVGVKEIFEAEAVDSLSFVAEASQIIMKNERGQATCPILMAVDIRENTPLRGTWNMRAGALYQPIMCYDCFYVVSFLLQEL
jgi:hypothetical protein